MLGSAVGGGLILHSIITSSESRSLKHVAVFLLDKLGSRIYIQGDTIAVFLLDKLGSRIYIQGDTQHFPSCLESMVAEVYRMNYIKSSLFEMYFQC